MAKQEVDQELQLASGLKAGKPIGGPNHINSQATISSNSNQSRGVLSVPLDLMTGTVLSKMACIMKI